ncbi:hypothetical protein COP2_047087 [Malus domestica]
MTGYLYKEDANIVDKLLSCSFERNIKELDRTLDDNINLVSSSLKFLEVKHCNARVIVVWDAPNLEPFTFISSSFSLLESIMLYDSCNSKHIVVHAQHLKRLHIYGSHDSLKATITAPNLVSFDFSGYLKSKISLKAPSLRETTISLNEFWDEDNLLNAFNGPWKYFPTLADFLKEFACSKNVTLIVCNCKVIFPDEFRNTFSSPLPGLILSLRLMASNPPRTETEYFDLLNSLCWVAPSAKTIFPQLIDPLLVL